MRLSEIYGSDFSCPGGGSQSAAVGGSLRARRDVRRPSYSGKSSLSAGNGPGIEVADGGHGHEPVPHAFEQDVQCVTSRVGRL